MYEEDQNKEFERRKWAFLRDLDHSYKYLEEEKAKPLDEQLKPAELLDKWEAYLANVKATCEAAKSPEDLPPKIDRISKLESEIEANWPVSNELADYLLAVEEAWGVFR